MYIPKAIFYLLDGDCTRFHPSSLIVVVSIAAAGAKPHSADA